MSDDSITRVRYFADQFLGADDFQTEQQYHLAMRRRHNLAHHSWGIVTGLEIRKDNSSLSVTPGIAIDGYGRELVLAQPHPLDPNQFKRLGSTELGVWLLFTCVPFATTVQRNGAAEADRWRESARVRMANIDPTYPDMRIPKGVPAGDLDFSPTRTPPSADTPAWQVYLGKITQIQNGAAVEYLIDPRGRPYAGLVGAQIDAPDRSVRVTLGPIADQPDCRFAVQTFTERKQTPVTIDTQTPVTIDTQTLFTIDTSGALDMKGDCTIAGDLQIGASGAIEFTIGAEPTTPLPWRIYAARSETGAGEEMRVELPPASDGPGRLVIGAWSEADKKFKPLLTVANTVKSNEPAVTVHGDLVVRGVLKETFLTSREVAALAGEAGLAPTLETITARQLWKPFVERQLQLDAGRAAVITQLPLAATKWQADQQDMLFTGLLSQPDLNQACARALLAQPELLHELVGKLLKSEPGPGAVAGELLKNTDALNSLVDTLITKKVEQERLVERLAAQAEVLNQFIALLLKNGKAAAAVPAIIQGNGFAELVERLRSVICPPEEPA